MQSISAATRRAEPDLLRDLLRQAGAGRWRSALRGLRNRADTRDDSQAAMLDVAAALARIPASARPPAIVVPIHNAARELDDCLASLVRHTSPLCPLILIDDASTDPSIDGVLAKYAVKPGVTVHRNARNLGFTRSVNLGLEIAGRADAILLNSDTKVTPRWVENLRLAAYAGERVATATPFSNNAGAFSAPEPGRDNPLPDWLGLDDYARLVTQASGRRYPEVPTGNGFCLYIRRDCIDQIGVFDAEAFPRGYGEENDFCMRARAGHRTHVVDDATFIYHVRGASFGAEKADLLRRGRALLDERYPDYSSLVLSFDRNPRLRQVRAAIAGAVAASRKARQPVRPRRLRICTSGEGVERSPDWSIYAMLAKPDHLDLHRLGDRNLELLETAAVKAMDGLPVIANWIVAYAIEAVEVSASVPRPDALRDLCGTLNIPYVE